MNKKIKQLADKVWSLDIEPNPHFQLCLQAFAESIVQECVGICEDHVSVKDIHEGAPPETHKTWVVLSDEEVEQVFPAIATYNAANKTLYHSIARAIEAKLKEKSYG